MTRSSMLPSRQVFRLFVILACLAGCSGKSTDRPPAYDPGGSGGGNTRDGGSVVVPIDDGGDADHPVNCTDASACGVTVTAAASAIPADGKATDAITVKVNPPGFGTTVELTIAGPGTWADGGQKTVTVNVDARGEAGATFVSDAGGGTATITARVTGRDAIAQVAISMPVLGSISVTQQYTLMGVRSSGFQEANQLTFKIVAADTTPYPRGLQVQFTHKPIGGSTINNQPTCAKDQVCTVMDTGTTDEKGEVKLNLISGTVAGAATVTIIATAGGQTKTIDTSAPIVGAKVSGTTISVECTPRNVPAYVDTDCINSRVDAPVKCTVTLTDRFGNSVGIEKTVNYASEAGVVGPPQSTPRYPADHLGQATGTINTNGGPVPVDVAPFPEELHSASFTDACHPSATVHNPRDGIVSVIAWVEGEEGFKDENGDGAYNMGEPFIDLAEPFVDSNDNNVHDVGEAFKDMNGNGHWDGPNGVWDSSTTLWTETRIVYSGQAWAISDIQARDLLSRFFLATFVDPETPPDATFPPGAISLSKSGTTDVGLWFADANFNVMAPDVIYAADTRGGDPASAKLVTLPPMRPVRSEGFFIKRDYCDGMAPASCDTQFPPSSTAKQCIPKISLTSFENGVAGTVHVTASSSQIGGFRIIATATILKTTASLSLDGTVNP